MILKNIAICFNLLLFSVGIAMGQINSGVLSTNPEQQSNSVPKEKLYVHTDQDFYLAGEIVWFKVYISDAATHQPTDLSSVAYLEILDAEQLRVLQFKIAVEKGIGEGSAFLPVSLPSGNFKLRAYTSWMKNFSPDAYFEKNITIINAIKTPEEKDTTKVNDFDIQFFPEGGNLLADVEGKVAFKAVDGYGNGVNFTGTLLNSLNQEVAVFKPLKFGIGSFKFIPENGMQYRAVINYGSKELIKQLMPVNIKGYAMQLNEIGSDTVQIKIAHSADKDSLVYLLVHQQEKTTILQEVETKDGVAQFNMAKNRIGEGISCFTVFDSQMQPVCERLYFKRPTKKLELRAKTDKLKYLSREKVALQIQSKDEKENYVTADLSVSVFLKDSLQNIAEANIVSYLWLKSDIKGKIENVNYYFENENKETNQALDNLLLTQGWRKFKRENPLNNQMPLLKFKPEYQQNIIKGTVVYKNSGKPAPNVLASLSVLGSTEHLYGARSDSVGNITFYTKNILGPVKLALQAYGLKDSLYKLKLDEPFIKQELIDNPTPLNLSKYYSKSILNRSIYMQVQNIYNADKLKMFVTPSAKEVSFYGNALDEKYILSEYVRFPTIEEIFREYVPEVVVTNKDKIFSLTVYNVQDKMYLNGAPLVLLDGVPVDNINRLMTYNPLKIKDLDVIAKKYYVGPLIFGGILNFSSLNGNFKDFDLGSDELLVDYDGLQIQREFYTPLYENQTEKASRIPDFRTLLYWAADVKTSTSGTKDLDFYTSDLKGNYTVVLQGLTDTGRLGYSTYSFTVE
ncbi:MAG TPA: hypothetical protein VFM79_11275 [Pelobium sp.]|nr:hypothetical protein [Pelobium sp.]